MAPFALKTTSYPVIPSPTTTASSSCPKLGNWVSNFWSKSLTAAFSGALALTLSLSGVGLAEGKAGVNKPELLPKQFTTVIDVAGFLSDGQVRLFLPRAIRF